MTNIRLSALSGGSGLLHLVTCMGIIAIFFEAAGLLGAAAPNPTVIGPIPATAQPGDSSHDYPFFSTTVDLAARGYVEEEFFFEGTANRYNTPAGATGSIIDGGHPYRSRLIVRRPASNDQFNGTVLLEWQNVTNSYDLDGLWIASSEHLIRRGYAWIGVSAQGSAITNPATGLKAWSPNRYATLDVTANGAILDESLSYDIFSQAAQAVRSPKGVDPTGGLQVKRVFGIGVSQSANRLLIYHNSIHPLAGVLDGFFLVGTNSAGVFRTDLDVRVFKLVSETDLAALGQAANRQPDSDHFRRWEAAGVAHLDFHEIEGIAPLQARDLGPAPTSPPCDLPPFSRIPAYYALNAAYDHMVRWVRDNIPPPSAAEIEVAAMGPPPVVARDAYGNALGGLRLPQLAVPLAVNSGMNSGPGSCRLYGTFQPFDDATLRTLYPYHTTYVIQVIEATLDNLKRGFIVPEDAAATIAEATFSNVGAQ